MQFWVLFFFSFSLAGLMGECPQGAITGWFLAGLMGECPQGAILGLVFFFVFL